ncbi:MAG: RdgB/HAM1 family non-canonical purine NTP pyrophosphatase [Flavobacteriaceae bacterium]|nr:RdgB/HAM1 family non-canonical purine NTP pyrophosphatase [Flavobacteriaceae bacterium]
MNENLPKLVFATQNPNKAAEISRLLEGCFVVKTLADLNHTEDIPETSDTFRGNAHLKASFVKNKFGTDCFADDSGLEVEALGGAPGVFSARFAGASKNDAANMQKLLDEINAETNRNAQFRTVICLMIGEETHFYEGIIHGQITRKARGKNGFGYDPVFIPEGYNKTFAEMTAAEKSSISHRGIAIREMANFLRERSI